jgi:hypothetical protein
LGEEISLEGGEVRRVVEGSENYASIKLLGVVPSSIGPGTYHARYVHFLFPGRGRILAFKILHLGLSVVDGPPCHREREWARLFGVRFLG